ncbi:MAG: single-stranded DNA-binding protein [Bacteroidota bacterium]
MVNKVILIGNLGRDPEVRRLESGVAVAKFSMATNETYKDRKTDEWQTITEWHDIVCWRGLADRAERDLKKGKLIYVEGKLTHRKFQDKEGNDRRITEVVANTFRLLERKESSNSSFSASMPTEEYVTAGSSSMGGGESIPVAKPAAEKSSGPADDDLPF